jgi:hypothetical protein
MMNLESRTSGFDAAHRPGMTVCIEPVPVSPRQRASATPEGDFMKRLTGAVAMLVAAAPVFAADVATCTLSPDKRTVTVTATNPYSKVMACEVNCDMAIPNGIGTVVCVKPVPVGAKDFVMCTEIAAEGRSYTRVKGAEVNCPDPSAPPPGSKADSGGKVDTDSKDDDDDDAKMDEQMQKMMKQGQEMLDRMKQKQK